MPYKSATELPSTLSNLTLSQANYWARIYDACVAQGMDKSQAAATAWKSFKNKFKKDDDTGRWSRIKESASLVEVLEIGSTHCYIVELTKSQIIGKSKHETPDRFKGRLDSGKDWSIDRVGILELVDKSPDLEVYFKVKSHRVGLQLVDFVRVLRKQYSSSQKSSTAVTKAMAYCLSRGDIKVNCSCPDFKYRFSFMATKLNYGLETFEDRPADKTNPDSKGGVCKHILKILNTPSLWKPKIIAAVNNAVKHEPGILTGNYQSKEGR